MGFSIQNVVILYWLKHHGIIKVGDAVLELGSQQINNDVIEHLSSVDGLAKLFGVAPFTKTFDWKVRDPQYLKGGMPHLPEDAPFARHLYEHLGLKYASVDIDNNPHAIKLDLNYDPAPQEHKGKYALVTNLGTTEHVVNQLNAFKVIHDLTARNGVMVHSLPFQGFEDHGLVNYTMKFFWLLVRSNMYDVIDADVSAWKRTSIPVSIVDFTKKHSNIFSNKDHVERLEMQDTGITMVLQKCHEIDFVPPIDTPEGMKTNDPVMKKKYWTEFDRNSTKVRLMQINHFIKKMLNI
jgi:hypothetical protein